MIQICGDAGDGIAKITIGCLHVLCGLMLRICCMHFIIGAEKYDLYSICSKVVLDLYWWTIEPISIVSENVFFFQSELMVGITVVCSMYYVNCDPNAK